MAFCDSPDTFSWLQALPHPSKWKSSSISMCICSSPIRSHPSLNLSVSQNPNSQNCFTFSIIANLNLPISLWTSNPFKRNPNHTNFLDSESISNLMLDFIEAVLSYGPRKNKSFSIRIPKPPDSHHSNLKDMFNLAFLTFVFLVCIYEAPSSLRAVCLDTIKNNLVTCRSRKGSRLLMVHLGSNLEEQWMRSLNLAITNWIMEIKSRYQRSLVVKSPSPLFSYAFSTIGLWKVHLYCPVVAMEMENSSSSVLTDERLAFSLNYHQLEGVIQFNYRISVHQKWIDVAVNTDNVRCDIIRLVNDNLLAERGVGEEEKHFPSRISIQLTPTVQTNVLTVSVTKSSENPVRELEFEKNIEATIEPPNTFFGLKVSAGETTTTSMKPWKFEQSVYGYSANLNWFLHDSVDGREVFSSRPSKVSLMNPRAWFKNRYANALRPFTKQGGVVFAGDKYGESVCWKVDKEAMGKTMEWEIRGCIWLTYWPNKHNTFYNETRKLEFKDMVYLNLV